MQNFSICGRIRRMHTNTTNIKKSTSPNLAAHLPQEKTVWSSKLSARPSKSLVRMKSLKKLIISKNK